MTLLYLLWVWRAKRLTLGQLGLHFQMIAIDLPSSLVMIFLRKSGSLVVVWIKSLTITAWCSFCPGSRNHRTNFARTYFMTKSYIKILDTVVFGVPISAVLTLSVADLCWLQPIHIQHSQGFCLLQAFQNMNYFQKILHYIWSVCATLLFALHSLHHPPNPSESLE